MKRILITGSGTGIGKHTAIALARRGHFVYATTHFESESTYMNKLAVNKNLPLKSFKLDITIKEDRQKIQNLDFNVLINNAAYGESGSIIEIPVDKIRNNFEINVFSALELTQLALKKIICNNSGRIIFNTSLSGRITLPFLGPYCSTKFALEALADSLKQELKQINENINIILVEPGSYHTGFNQLNMSRKYKWMDKNSLFYSKINKIKKNENRYFNLTEYRSTKTIVNKFIHAVEDNNPSFRYVAPMWQGIAIQAMRILGK